MWSSEHKMQYNYNTRKYEPIRFGAKPKIPRKDFPSKARIKEINEWIDKQREKKLIREGKILFMPQCPFWRDWEEADIPCSFGTYLTWNGAMCALEQHLMEVHVIDPDEFLRDAVIDSWTNENAKEVARNKI